MATSDTSSTLPQHIVIVGGGIVGASTLYYAARHAARAESPLSCRITLIESSEGLAPAASGKSGGFLALDWHGEATASLAELSYRLHEQLAQEGNGKKGWGYRTVDTLQVNIDNTKSRSKCPPELNWVDPAIVTSTSVLGRPSSTAQVTPKLLVEYLVSEAQKRPGVEARVGVTASLLELDEQSEKVNRLLVRKADGTEEAIDCDRVVLAAGPWTGSLLKSLLPDDSASNQKHKIPHKLLRKGRSIDGARAHSIVVRGSRPTTAHCLFTDMRYTDKAGKVSHVQAGAPEVYPRNDGTVYVCGGSDSAPLPASADQVTYDEKQTAKLLDQIKVLCPDVVDDATRVEKEQACYLPGGSFNGPLIDGSPDHGLYIASGHTCWGITLGPGTGKVMSELLFDGKANSADISMLKA